MSRFLRGRVVYNNTDFLSYEKSLYCFARFFIQKKSQIEIHQFNSFFKLDVGNVLSSQEVALQVFSPLQVFTTVFGMGTGVFLTLGHQQILLTLLVRGSLYPESCIRIINL